MGYFDADTDHFDDDHEDVDVCPHGKGFDEECEDCDDEDDFDEADETIPVCPECGSDDLEITGQDLNGDDEYECNDCGECFGQEDLEED
jgi:DNA-directed RNA polymerase subunit RPC12/RpoP